jgi:Family of unknown function (DUF6200)
MSMAAQGTTPAEQREQRGHREQDATSKPGLVMVELDRRQSRKQIRRLRKGRGKLVGRIEDIVDELTRDGTVKAGAQPVVIVVRERTNLPWPLRSMDSSYNDDDDDDED